MPDFTVDQRARLRNYVINYQNWIANDIDKPLGREIGIRPSEIQDSYDRLSELATLLQGGSESEELNASHLPFLKRAVIHQLRVEAVRTEERVSKVSNRRIRQTLDERMDLIAEFSRQSWFDDTVAVRAPKLSDFLSIQRAEAAIPARRDTGLKAREHDEKCHILLSPALFHSDLGHFRTICGLRDVPVSVIYIDIDDFKDFNTEYGEPTVDREVLPRFMSALEAHVFSHGHAYKIGGDEYVVLLPNATTSQAVDLLAAFQHKLRDLDFFGIDKHITISLGICEVHEDTVLTDSQVEERAAKAKKHAKESGKNRIAVFNGSGYSDTELTIVQPDAGPLASKCQ